MGITQWAAFLFTARTFYFRDLTFFYAPLIVEAARQWSAGVLPAWNPHLACGTPLAADPNVGAFFPDSALVSALGSGLAGVKALLLFRLLAVPLAAYFALRRIVTPKSAFLGAALVSLCGPIGLSLSSFPTHLAGAGLFLPLAVAGFLAGSRRVTGLAAGALLFGLTVLAGSPEMVLQGAIVFLVCGLQRPWPRSIARAVATLSTGFLVAALQWLPALLLYPRTPRGLGWRLSTPPGFLSFPPMRLLELLWPGLLGNPASPSSEAYWGRGWTDGSPPYLLSVAVGLLPLVLLPAALRHPFGRRLAAVGLVFLLLSFGKFLPGGLTLLRLPPLSSLRYPEKWMIGVVLCLAAIAAVGLSRGEERPGERHASVSRAASLLVALGAVSAAVACLAPRRAVGMLQSLGLSPPAGPLAIRTLQWEAIGMLACACAIAGLLSLRRRAKFASIVPTLLIVVALADRLPRTVGAVPSTTLGDFAEESRETARARSACGEGRFFYDHEATTLLDPHRPFTGTLYGLSYAGNTDIDQFSDVRARGLAEVLQTRLLSDQRKIEILRLCDTRVIDTNDPDAMGAGLTDLGETVAGRRLYAMAGSYPARLFFRGVRARDRADALGQLLESGFPIQTVAVVEGAPFDGPVGRHQLGPLSRARPDAFEIEVITETPALLQLAVTFDPKWHIRVDGTPRSPEPVDSAFLGVRVPPGRHQVTGEFSDPAFPIGAAISVATLALLGFLQRRSRRGERRLESSA